MDGKLRLQVNASTTAALGRPRSLQLLVQSTTSRSSTFQQSPHDRWYLNLTAILAKLEVLSITWRKVAICFCEGGGRHLRKHCNAALTQPYDNAEQGWITEHIILNARRGGGVLVLRVATSDEGRDMIIPLPFS